MVAIVTGPIDIIGVITIAPATTMALDLGVVMATTRFCLPHPF
jgi:hypothetical protein